MKIKTPQPFGDPYVDSCFQFEFEELEETRVWHTIDGLKDVPFIADTDKKKALAIAERELQQYADYHFAYYWVGNLRSGLGYPGEPQNTYLLGIQKSRSKSVLCGGMAMWEFDQNHLANAVRWWIKSCAIQLSIGKVKDGFPMLNLAYIAESLGLATCHTSLLKQAQLIQNILFDSVGAKQRYDLAHQQGEDAIKQAISLLCSFYL
jgi:hypothetical protein